MTNEEIVKKIQEWTIEELAMKLIRSTTKTNLKYILKMTDVG